MGNTITKDGRCKTEIIERIQQAKIMLNIKKKLFLTVSKISIEKRVALYGCMSAIKRLEAFELWCYRQIMKVSLVDRTTNVEVFEKAKSREK